ncbi:MAG: aminopeptidase [Pseudomonadota bacterium]|nr:aminopeptidase [Pseudomonadota bacterium]
MSPFYQSLKHGRFMLIYLIILTALVSRTPELIAQERRTLAWPEVARKIVARLSLEPGERVIVIAHPDMFQDLVPHLRYEVIKTGGIDLGVINILASSAPIPWETGIIEPSYGSSRAVYRRMFEEVDAGIMLPGAVPAHPAYAALQERLKSGQGRTIHIHWTEDNSVIPLPGQPVPSLYEIDGIYQSVLLNTNYGALSRIQRRFERALRKGEVHVATPLGTDLRFQVGSRPVNRQDGDASARRADAGVILIDREIELPAGVIRVAPVEETVSGIIAFPPSQWDGRPVQGLRLRFEKGQVIEITADTGEDHVRAEMDKAGAAGRYFREFALGFNPELTIPDHRPWIPYYGYGAGVIRLSLGDNSELGGAVSGGYVRWNFFTDSTIAVGNEVWVEKGKLVMPVTDDGE